jgi:hypothetical protein
MKHLFGIFKNIIFIKMKSSKLNNYSAERPENWVNLLLSTRVLHLWINAVIYINWKVWTFMVNLFRKEVEGATLLYQMLPYVRGNIPYSELRLLDLLSLSSCKVMSKVLGLRDLSQTCKVEIRKMWICTCVSVFKPQTYLKP